MLELAARGADVSRRQVDPAQLQGEALAKWYRRSPDEIEEERNLRAQAEHEAFYGVVGSEHAESWQEARVAPPSVRADMPLARPLPAPGRSKGRRVDWHAAELRYEEALREALYGAKIPPPPTFSLYHTPAR